MKQVLITLGLLIWFFGVRIDGGDPGVFVSMLIGPFVSQVECDRYRSRIITSLKDVLINASSCLSKEEI